MLAARDQENLVHGHQAAAAAKPLNQGGRQLAPKTPANKAPKTPFKIPLNDENGAMGFGGGKGLKTIGKGDENAAIGSKKAGLGDKNAFVTPMGQRNRAPLGLKTTNAKAKAFQTPTAGAVHNDPNKVDRTARKPKPRLSYAERTKLEVLGDEDVLAERDIEYMPPKVEDLPDIPNDHVDLNLSMFQNGNKMKGYMSYFRSYIDPADGLSSIQRADLEDQKRYEILDKRIEAKMMMDIESDNMPCTHFPECGGDECKNMPEIRRKAQEKYKTIIASLDSKPEDNLKPIKKPVPTTKGPTGTISKRAATALSQPNPITSTAPKPLPKSTTVPRSNFPTSLVASRKMALPPTNPSPHHHTAATATSRTTIGYAKGRATSATLRKTVLPSKDGASIGSNQSPKDPAASANPAAASVPDTTLAPAAYLLRYGVPEVGSRMWMRCREAGVLGAEEEPEDEILREDLFREDAEAEFVLTW